MEFVWQQNGTSLFTHVLFDGYAAPLFLNFEYSGLLFDPEKRQASIEQRAAKLEALIREMKDAYQTDNLLVPIGDDFSFVASA